MIKNRKGVALPVEFLVRVLIMISLVIIVFSIGKEVGKYVLKSFFGTDLEENFNEFVNELNKLGTINVPSRQVFMTLDPNTAIIGFSSALDGFRCYACGSNSIGITSSFNKPDDVECKGKSCVCLCSSPLQIGQKKPYEMNCDKIKCKPLNKDLAEVVELQPYIEKLEKEGQQQLPFSKNAKWTGGFLFERHSRGDFISNGLPQQPGRRFTVYVNKESTEDNTYIAVCPIAECKYSFKQEQKVDVTDKICNIIDACLKSQDIPKAPPSNFCEPGVRDATRLHSKEHCEKIKDCVQLNPKVKVQGKCEPVGGFYQLSFLP